HRILGFLGSAVRDGAFPVSEPQRVRVEHEWASWLAHALRVERLLLEATEVLDAHGIPSIVLKGLALGHTVYGDAALRVVGDVDVLVEPRNFTRAANVLIAEIGAERALPELRRGFDDRFGKEILLSMRGLEFDLHRMFVEGPYGAAIRLEDLWEHTSTFELGGRELLSLAPPARAVHAAYAAALGDWPPRLNALRDFAQTWDRDPAVLVAAFELAGTWRCGAVVRSALERVREVFGTEIAHVPSIVHGKVPPRDRMFLASYRGGGRGYLRNVVAPVAIDGFPGKVAFMAAIAFPDRDYLAARGASRTGFIRGGWVKARPKR